MNYYLDTEFYENGPRNPIRLISIALVCEDGREFYAEAECDVSSLSQWLKDNVVPHLSGKQKPLHQIAQDIVMFIGLDTEPKFWGYYADYDWVVFCQIFGSMLHLPNHFPKYCLDIKQEMVNNCITKKELPEMFGNPHHALDDARWNWKAHWYINH